MPIENDDQTMSVGQNPAYAYDTEAELWRRVKCDGNGAVFIAALPTTSSVVEPTITGDTINAGAAEVVSVTNTTSSILTILDGSTPVGLVLPLASLSAPIFVTTSLVIKSASAALGEKAAIIWRAM